MQTNNPEYQDENVSQIDKLSEVESFVNFGEVDTSNMFKQYYFAEVQNEYQMKCMKKCGLNLTLQNYNPAITKFSRIWVDIYDMNPTSNTTISTEKDYPKTTTNNVYTQYKNEINKNIIYFKEEGVFKEVEKLTNNNSVNYPRGVYNRSLSGWYVVTEMKISYNNYEKNLKTHLILNRIEHKPTYKSEYDLAKKAIDKYKEENLIECIYNNIDDYSY